MTDIRAFIGIGISMGLCTGLLMFLLYRIVDILNTINKKLGDLIEKT